MWLTELTSVFGLRYIHTGQIQSRNTLLYNVPFHGGTIISDSLQ